MATLVKPSFGPTPPGGGWGWRQFPPSPPENHTGIDFVGSYGSPIRAVKSGVVHTAAPNGTYNKYGNVIVIKHDDPTEAPMSLYAHLSKIRVRKGQHVKAGQIIGEMGNTSAERDNPAHKVMTHLHFELLKYFPAAPKEGRIDPTPFLFPTSTFYPVPSPTPPSATPLDTDSEEGPYQYTNYSYGQGPLRGLHDLAAEPCFVYPKCGPNAGKPVPCGGLNSVRWTSNTPWPFATAPGAGLADIDADTKTGLFMALMLATPILLAGMFRNERYR